jgi:hypothetical protein
MPGTNNQYPTDWWNSPTGQQYQYSIPGMWNYQASRAGQPVGSYLGDPGATLATAMNGPGASAAYMGYANLANIMASNGKTDPRLYNQGMTQIAQGGQAQQQGIQQQLAQRGWGNSGVGAALQQSAAGATQDRRSQYQAQQAATEEARKRSDLQLLYQMFVDPSLQGAAIATNQYAGKAAQDSATSAQQQQAILSLGQIFATMFA